MGLNYYAPQFNPDLYISAFLNTIVELPPYFIAPYLFQRLGRRTSLMFGLLIGGIACLTTYGIPSSEKTAILTLTLVSKFCITFTYLCGKLLEDETFPTVVRSEGHSMVSAFDNELPVIFCGSSGSVKFVTCLFYTDVVLKS